MIMTVCRSACKAFLLRKVVSSVFVRFYSPRLPESLGGRPFIKHMISNPYKEDEPPQTMKSYAERLCGKDPNVTGAESVDVGETYTVRNYSKAKRKCLDENRKNHQMEKLARERKLYIPLDQVKEQWLDEYGPVQRQDIAEHYGIFKDLFNDAHFTPIKHLEIYYDYDDDYFTPVHTGNHIIPSEATSEPHLSWTAEPDSLWTILMTAPDSHLTENDAEYLHWMVGNIPGCSVIEGEIMCEYLMPFPTKGTGLHRYVFLLYRQSHHIQFDEHRPANCFSSGSDLDKRTFRNFEFYARYETSLTPAGLAFFQSEWEPSVRNVFHHALDMNEPVYEYVHPPAYRSILRKYPRRQPFDRYYDRYRDKKDIAEEVMRLKLNMISPFKQWESETKYPLAHLPPLWGKVPTWLRKRKELAIRRQEQFKDLPRTRYSDSN